MKEKLSEEVNEVKDDLEDYINARLDMTKLHAAENLSRFVSGMVVKVALSYLFFFVLLFASLAMAFWLNHILENDSIGFLLVASFYMLIAIIFYLLRKSLIQRPIIQSFIQLFFPKFVDYDESK
ncbi:phage holin family protein [Carboxylicivirga sp. M1479]|uniref:phage holin family protein n=1 Tax=Carboxylicivirga sp. M1479 TaxID=2594476 RepID=UPI0011789CD3|nr:phage holin family protein [Carboxylicivirga sp. M1479]TRX70794.1 phage holin family protein [Carboxylicivirga sp. M1479]